MKIYLGDEVYAEFDEKNLIMILSNDHDHIGARNVIQMEESVVMAFFDFVAKIKAERGVVNEKEG